MLPIAWNVFICLMVCSTNTRHFDSFLLNLHAWHCHRILYRSPSPLFFSQVLFIMIRHSTSNRSSHPWKYSKWHMSRGWLLLFTVLAEWRIMTNSTYAKNNGDWLRYSILWRCSVPFRASDCGWRKGVSRGGMSP